jgi:hypothetical protein
VSVVKSIMSAALPVFSCIGALQARQKTIAGRMYARFKRLLMTAIKRHERALVPTLSRRECRYFGGRVVQRWPALFGLLKLCSVFAERGRAIACGALRFLRGSTFLLALVFAPCPHQSPPRSSSCERLEPRRDPLQPSGAQSQETVEREKVTWPGLNGLPTICPNSLMLLYAANGVGAGGRLECK